MNAPLTVQDMAPAPPTLAELQALQLQVRVQREAALLREGDAVAYGKAAEKGVDALKWLAQPEVISNATRADALRKVIAELSPTIFRVLEARATASARDARLAERAARVQLACWVSGGDAA